METKRSTDVVQKLSPENMLSHHDALIGQIALDRCKIYERLRVSKLVLINLYTSTYGCGCKIINQLWIVLMPKFVFSPKPDGLNPVITLYIYYVVSKNEV